MFEVIRDALIWVMSWVLDRRPHGGEAFRLLFLLAFSVLATWLTFYWKNLAYRYPMIRRRVMPEERYFGRYLQAVWRRDELRYSFVKILYNWRRHRYEVAGRTYNPAGEKLAEFQSTYVRFPSEKDANIEFIWHATNDSNGYTCMSLEDGDEDYIQGAGRVMKFANPPEAYPLKFKHMPEHHVRNALGVGVPTIAEEPEFVRKFHAKYGPDVVASFQKPAKAEDELAQPAA